MAEVQSTQQGNNFYLISTMGFQNSIKSIPNPQAFSLIVPIRVVLSLLPVCLVASPFLSDFSEIQLQHPDVCPLCNFLCRT